MGLFLYLDKYFLTSKIKIKQSVSDMIVKNAGSVQPRALWGLCRLRPCSALPRLCSLPAPVLSSPLSLPSSSSFPLSPLPCLSIHILFLSHILTICMDPLSTFKRMKGMDLTLYTCVCVCVCMMYIYI